MNFVLNTIISVLLISEISCSQRLKCKLWTRETVQCPTPRTTTPKSETTIPTPQPTECPYSVGDVDEVVNMFYTDKAAASVKVDNVLMIQQELIRDVTCTSTCAETDCPLPAPDVAAVAQFGRYYDGNQRAIEVMQLEVERIFYLLSLEDSYSECACELKRRTVQAAKNYGSGIIGCTDDSVDNLTTALGNVVPSQQVVEFFTNYHINNIYFTAESDLRKCKTKFIDAFYTELASINASLDSCTTKLVCSEF